VARALASLNHPNVVAIYGLDGPGSVRALMMESVQGQTRGHFGGHAMARSHLTHHGVALHGALVNAK
jgi:hypothetical protein